MCRLGEGRWALFLDIDGTLLDLAARPDLVVVPPELADTLHTLARVLDGALALVSGRALAEIDQLFPGLPAVAGSHGGEWRQGGRLRATGAPAPELTALAAGAATLPGIMVERKPQAVALHYRDNPKLAGHVRALAERAVAAASVGLRLLEGKSVIEVVPAEVDKGRAVARFMAAPPFAGRVPLYVGDDVTDEYGFQAVNRLGGLSIRVGDLGASAARRQLSSPTAVRRWLRRTARQEQEGGRHDHQS